MPKTEKIIAEIPVKDAPEEETRVAITLPLLTTEDADNPEKVDQVEHVTVNGITTLIQRGERVEVTIPVFLALKNKYPKL